MGKITSLVDLPVEIVERIVAKCRENDIEVLEDDYKTIVEREDPRNKATKQSDDEENGWETEDEGMVEEEEEDLYINKDPYSSKLDAQNMEKVAFCKACDEYHTMPLCGGSVDEKAPGYRPSILQLARTSKFLRNLALPHIYGSVDFEAISNAALGNYLELIVPEYGHLVKDLWLRISCSENSEFFLLGEEDETDEERFEPEWRFHLSLGILQGLKNLETIDIDVTSLRNNRMEDMLDEIRLRGSSLKGLHLTADVMQTCLLTSQIGPLLESLPNLVHLELTGIDRQSSDGPLLRDVIAGLEHLKCLDIADAHCLVDDWAQADWKCKLTSLDIDDCQNISGDGVEALMLRHASSMHHLSLNTVPYQNIGNLNNGPQLDFPRLWTLALDNFEFTLSLVQRFSQCPQLERIELGTLEDMSPKELSEFVEKSRSTSNTEAGGFPRLHEIMLSSDWPTSSEDPAVDTLELICFENGITLEIEAPDSDDEDDDDDDDDDMSFDEDDPDQEYWDEGFTEEEEEPTDDEDFGDEDNHSLDDI